MSLIARCCLCAALLVMASACQSDNSDEPRMTERELMNRSKLNPYPEQVKTAFMTEHPNATVTDVATYTDEGGRVLYEVKFVRDERIGRAVYTSEGVPVPELEASPRPPTPPAAPAPPAPPASPRMPQQ